jgi:hypothetical protein
MKFASGIILVVFASFGQSVILNCRFDMTNWDVVSGYMCYSNTENTGKLTTIEEVRGEHSSGKGNEDVDSFYEYGNLTSIPTNLASFFPNLKAIIIIAPLFQLSSSDLKPFPNLVLLRFHSWYAKFTSLEGDLFQYTRKLQRINFSVPALKNVGANLLTGLNDLVYVFFIESGCIRYFDANTPQRIQELKQKLLLQCPPLETSTSPMTTPRTTVEI